MMTEFSNKNKLLGLVSSYRETTSIVKIKFAKRTLRNFAKLCTLSDSKI